MTPAYSYLAAFAAWKHVVENEESPIDLDRGDCPGPDNECDPREQDFPLPEDFNHLTTEAMTHAENS